MGCSSSALAHHILGLPHYKYGDDYPQIPYVEIQGKVDTKSLSFTYFPGTPKPGERIRFKLYVLDEQTKQPFREPLKVVFAKKQAFGSEAVRAVEIRPGVGPEGNDYKFFHAFESADAFEVRVHFPREDGTVEVVPLPVQIGETDPRPLFGAAVGILVVAVISVALIKRRQRRTDPKANPRGSEI